MDIKNFIRYVITENAEHLLETPLELSSPKASTFLNIIQSYYPDMLGHYKNVIFKKTLNDAFLEFSKTINKTPEFVEKVVAKGLSNVKTGNPFGVSGAKNFHTNNQLSSPLIDLETYTDKVNYLKSHPEELKTPQDLKTINSFFTPAVFDMINKAISRLSERHNEQVEKVKNGDLEGIVDPYTNQPIIDDDTAKLKLGAYYQNEHNYLVSHDLHNAPGKIESALNKKTISGLRWLYQNAKKLA